MLIEIGSNDVVAILPFSIVKVALLIVCVSIVLVTFFILLTSSFQILSSHAFYSYPFVKEPFSLYTCHTLLFFMLPLF
nr:MAG TPA: hypothetical protein [Caudoviricetes sp.]